MLGEASTVTGEVGRQVVFGAGLVAGYLGGRLMVWTLNTFTFPAGLHPWLALAGAVARTEGCAIR